jgi:DNA replication protein DnaC
MSSAASYQRVRSHLETLKLDAALAELDTVLETGAREELTAVEIVDELLDRELRRRFERRVKTNFKLSGLPLTKRLEDFDYDAQPGVPKHTIEELASLRFVNQGSSVIFLGPCGVGKTHLAIGLAVQALEAGHRAYFLTLHELVTRAAAARQKHRLHTVIRAIHRADLFVLDELGFLPLAGEDATFLFEIINRRYQSGKSTIVTSNKTFSQWSEIFPDTALTTALLDRLLHNGITVNIRGDSYRLKHRNEAGTVEPMREQPEE